MHHFEYKTKNNDKILHCENVSMLDIAKKVGTPVYVYSHATLKRHFDSFNNAFKNIDRLVCYSAKANSSLAILSLFAELGGGLDIVSAGELYRGLKAGFSPQKIVYSGVGKRMDEIDDALKANILMFNIESLDELEVINQRAEYLGVKAPISFRVNPDVDPKTHPYISTGLKKNKFGVDTQTALEGYKRASQMKHVDVVGIDCHIGSQITEVQPFKDALKNITALINQIQSFGIELKYLDMGGGLGITYNEEMPPHPDAYAKELSELVKDLKLKLILEPGRVIVGNAGALMTKVLYKKANDVRNFIIVDAGMNDLVRPTLYEAYHAIKPVKDRAADKVVADVVGPICESGDFLATNRELPEVKHGDLLAVMSAGAYGYVMSSNYCSRLKLAEVMVKDDQFYVIRNRQTYEDLIAGETVPQY